MKNNTKSFRIKVGVEKIPKKSRVQNPDNSKISGIGIWKSRKNPKKSRKIWQTLEKFWGFTVSWPSGFLANPRYSDFCASRDFNPRNSGFFLISGFYPRNFRKTPRIYGKSPRFIKNPRDSGYFTFGIGVFFVGWGIPTKSQFCFKITF